MSVTPSVGKRNGATCASIGSTRSTGARSGGHRQLAAQFLKLAAGARLLSPGSRTNPRSDLSSASPRLRGRRELDHAGICSTSAQSFTAAKGGRRLRPSRSSGRCFGITGRVAGSGSNYAGGAIANFNRGLSRGWQWLLVGLGVPHQLVSPQTWQRAMFVGTLVTSLPKHRSIVRGDVALPGADLAPDAAVQEGARRVHGRGVDRGVGEEEAGWRTQR